MATSRVASAYYAVVFVVYAYTLYFDWFYVDPNHQAYGGKFKFLTFWNLVLQTFYFGLCLLNSIVNRGSRQRSGLQRLRDNLHATLAFPVGMFVVMTFWAIYAIDRELVYPKSLDAIIPSWMNHVMHTTVLPILVVEKVLVYHRHPRRHNGIFVLSAFAIAYLLWILWIAYAADLWVYPILRVMSGGERAVFMMFLLMFFISIYLVGEALTNFIWRRERAVSAAAMKQK